MKDNLRKRDPDEVANEGRHHGKLRPWLIAAGIIAAAILGAGAGPGGCSQDNARAKAYVALSPVAVELSPDKLRAAADFYASLRPNAYVLSGEGLGMIPLYRPGTLLVVEPLPYNQLKEGMTAVFTEANGQRVAHYLVALLPDGWTTRGLNQKEEDIDPMTEKSYLGVVLMAFAPQAVSGSG